MSDLFFYISKLIWFLISPDGLLVCLLVLCLLSYVARWYRLLRLLAGGFCLAVLIISFVPVGSYLTKPLENRFSANPPLPEAVDGIIVLGGSTETVQSAFWDQLQQNSSAERLIYFSHLARLYPEATLVFTGGNGRLDRDRPSEADILINRIDVLGFDTARIVFEPDSRNTHENAIFSKRLINPKPEETWVLITSASHMPRSVGVFCGAGWSVLPYPVDHQTSPETLELAFDFSKHLSELKVAMREWVGLTAYYWTSKTSAWFPNGCA